MSVLFRGKQGFQRCPDRQLPLMLVDLTHDFKITFGLGSQAVVFRFQRESDNSWTAILNWTDKAGAPKERIYHMVRWAPPKQ